MNKASKVLIVDDVPSARKVIRRLLEKSGFTNIAESKDGQEALSLLKQDKFNLVISDWEMPQLSGIELLRALRKTAGLEKIGFLMITSAADREQVAAVGGEGLTNLLVKPFTGDALLSRVEEALKKQG